ncbi:arachidonate 12-lipoxygenase, 12R-type-like isoform X2 [Channa argus]|uniref:arachidonate 12-lipoxygenase, 12R-type-like isoform X2 n=1 Tax=Channa argus TaxID=215402 RepID=UPI003520A994
MPEYKLEVTTGDMVNAGSLDHIHITLVGTEGHSEATKLDNFDIKFKTGVTLTYTVQTNSSLGKLLLVKVEKHKLLFLPEDEWFCSKIVVTTPGGEVIPFPCYRWISRAEPVELREGRAVRVFEEDQPQLIDHRRKELIHRQSLFKWMFTDEKLPHISHYTDTSELPAGIGYSLTKKMEILYKKRIIGGAFALLGQGEPNEQWKKTEDIKEMFVLTKTKMSEYVAEHWKEDDFYGSQFLNAVNPNVITRCSELPPNFPVTEEMVKSFLEQGSSLQMEMMKGNIFVYNLKWMDGIPTKVYNGESLHVATGFCLFYMNPENKLKPIAIQLHQQPSEDNPIFLPSDSETDWLLAKMFIKNADLMQHQSVYHLMNTHYLAEAFTVATLRCLPGVHPLYKLLIPHTRYTLAACKKCSFGYEGLTELMRRAFSEVTYSSLCLPENITTRGLDTIPDFYYRDDGLKLWNIINNFVKGILEYYYPSDSDVQKDTELQEWISEIFNHGFLANKDSGIPAKFHAVEEVIKFITMVIFTVTAQHAAVNSGLFDYTSWVPNGSLLLHKPPPTTKGQSSMKTILETLPNIGETASFAAMAWELSNKYQDMVPLGSYPEEHFDEPEPKETIKEFQAELSKLSEAIATRNLLLKVPYTYLNPTEIENSVAI